MKKLYYFPLLLCTAICIAACDKEDAGTPSGTTEDKPISLIGQEAKPYQQRMEVPKVTDHSMFIVHSTNKYGVTYTEEWDKENRTQRWAAYSITDINSVSNWKRDNWKGTVWKGAYWNGDPFQEDSVIPHMYRTYASDHYNNGFDRGHIVNSADRLMSKNANGQTYYLSNMQPQTNGFNAGIWLNMENWVHNLGFSKQKRKTLYIAKGGTTIPTAKTPNPFLNPDEVKAMNHNRNVTIRVPRYFWMAILRLDKNDQYHAIAFWAEHRDNQDNNIKNYTISVDELEIRTGIDFFPNLPDEVENTVEAKRDLNDWDW